MTPLTVLVTGATGRLGRVLVPLLERRGHIVRAMSRRPGQGRVVGDLESGEGLAEAANGAEVVAHCASSPFSRTRNTDVLGTRRLVEVLPAEAHLLYISIVGVDRTWMPYYRAKLAAEKEVLTHPRWTVLRTTQWHPLLHELFDAVPAWLPVAPVPRIPVQPIAVSLVAEHFANAIEGEPAGRLPDIGGPEQHLASDLFRAWLAHRERRTAVVGLPLPGAMAGGCLCTPNRLPGATWQDFLDRPEASEGHAG